MRGLDEQVLLNYDLEKCFIYNFMFNCYLYHEPQIELNNMSVFVAFLQIDQILK